MKIVKFETFLANAGLRNYLFLRLTTDTGLTGVGEASLEWQERTVQTLCHEWLEARLLGQNPLDIDRIVGDLLRDQYQGGSTVTTAISGAEIALWDLLGKVCGQPVYQLFGGRYHKNIATYANGWYGGARTPDQFAERARQAIALGYTALKFDPFGVAWKTLARADEDDAVAIVAAVRKAAGPDVGLMIEYHGRLDYNSALSAMRRLGEFNPIWSEEPLPPENIDLLAQLKREAPGTIAAGERLYTLADFERLCSLRACDIVQMDIAHCGGLSIAKKIATLAAVRDMRLAPHCSVGPVALAAALHFCVSTQNFMVQESFAEFDVPWRNEFVCGWNPVRGGQLHLEGDEPGLGIELNETALAAHPYVAHSFPSLWDKTWLTNFTGSDRRDRSGGSSK